MRGSILTTEEKVLVTLFLVLFFGAPVWALLFLYVAGSVTALSDLAGIDWHGFFWRTF